MKKLFIKVADYIRKRLDEWAIRRVGELMPKRTITEWYRRIAERDLNIQTRTVLVKKGKLKYTLLVVKDRNLETAFNLGRHPEYHGMEPKEHICK